MTSQEAINALYEGKKVKRSVWNGTYICLVNGVPKRFTNKHVLAWINASVILFLDNDWEIYEEPIEEYQWLCQDVGSGDFFISPYITGDMDYGIGGTKYKVLKRLDETKRIRKG